MINIIHNKQGGGFGPKKVVENLIKGLKKIKYPYVLNKDINYCKRCYIPNSRRGLIHLWRAKHKVITGPNLYVFPDDIQWFVKLLLKKSNLYLVNSEWTLNLWKQARYNSSPIDYWPTGIDTDEFSKKNNKANYPVLIYHKNRDLKQLEQIKKSLKQSKIKYNIIKYGYYNQHEYLDLLSKTSFIIWHGTHESQGIAVQEAMSCDIPILILDVKCIGDSFARNLSNEIHNLYATSAPYFNDLCGIKITDFSKLNESIQKMFDLYNTFNPRQYILDNLSLEKQAKELINFFD